MKTYYKSGEVEKIMGLSMRSIIYLSNKYPDTFKFLKRTNYRLFTDDTIYLFMIYKLMLEKGFSKKFILREFLPEVAKTDCIIGTLGLLIIGDRAYMVTKVTQEIKSKIPFNSNKGLFLYTYYENMLREKEVI